MHEIRVLTVVIVGRVLLVCILLVISVRPVHSAAERVTIFFPKVPPSFHFRAYGPYPRKPMQVVRNLQGAELISTPGTEMSVSHSLAKAADAGIDLSQADLRNIAIAKDQGGIERTIRIRNAKLKNAVLSNSVISGMTFENCDFERAVLSNALLFDVEFLNCNLTNAKFVNSEVSSCRFKDCRAAHTDFSEAAFVRNVVADSDFAGSNFCLTQVQIDCFVNCDLSNAKFTGTQLGLVNIVASKLNGAGFDSSAQSYFDAHAKQPAESFHGDPQEELPTDTNTSIFFEGDQNTGSRSVSWELTFITEDLSGRRVINVLDQPLGGQKIEKPEDLSDWYRNLCLTINAHFRPSGGGSVTAHIIIDSNRQMTLREFSDYVPESEEFGGLTVFKHGRADEDELKRAIDETIASLSGSEVLSFPSSASVRQVIIRPRFGFAGPSSKMKSLQMGW